jgi:pantoate--beta-alanine ligase
MQGVIDMKVIETIAEMKQLRRQMTGTVGFVPTMGYLHEGHLALVRHARQENPHVIVSIFVNPTQFGPKEDFKTYPRDISRDLSLLEPMTDVVFIPPASEMYPEGFNAWVEICGITDKLEGAARPGHFRGVATVVAKLFNITEPTVAYFGQKDAQQVAVIKKMVTDLNMNLNVVALPTVREADGLAMSSRNTYLNPDERRGATVLYRSLKLAQELWSNGENNAAAIHQQMTELITKEPLAKIEYISIASANTLEELEQVTPPALVSMAVRFGTTRLIDNLVLK